MSSEAVEFTRAYQKKIPFVQHLKILTETLGKGTAHLSLPIEPHLTNSLGTVHGLARESGRDLDLRRFRPNVVIETNSPEPFEEDKWVGRTLVFGNESGGGSVRVIMKDLRCVMVNLHPDTAAKDSEVMKTIVRLNENNAGVYATVAGWR